ARAPCSWPRLRVPSRRLGVSQAARLRTAGEPHRTRREWRQRTVARPAAGNARANAPRVSVECGIDDPMPDAMLVSSVGLEQHLKDFAADHMNPARGRPPRRAQHEAPMVQMMMQDGKRDRGGLSRVLELRL